MERDARVQAARLRQEKEVMSEVKEKPSIGATSTRIAAHLDRPDIIRDWDYFASQHAQRRWGEPPSRMFRSFVSLVLTLVKLFVFEMIFKIGDSKCYL